MKEVTYEDWIKNPTPREMWVWGKDDASDKEEMEKTKSKFSEECKEDCIVHKLVTHNTCLFCPASRKSPYLKDELLGKSDEEIEAIQKEVKEELGE